MRLVISVNSSKRRRRQDTSRLPRRRTCQAGFEPLLVDADPTESAQPGEGRQLDFPWSAIRWCRPDRTLAQS